VRVIYFNFKNPKTIHLNMAALCGGRKLDVQTVFQEAGKIIFLNCRIRRAQETGLKELMQWEF
jgi:hypothetical protein